MRTLHLVGATKPGHGERFAHKCAWCGRWDSFEDMARAYVQNAKVTHGCCAACFKKQMAAIDAMPGPEAA